MNFELQLTKTMEVPPGGWQVTHAQTGVLVRGTDVLDLLRTYNAHSSANGFREVHQRDFMKYLSHELCAKLPPGFCERRPATSSSPPGAPSAKLDGAAILAGTKALARFVASGFQRVSPDEADRRAAICAGCPLNVELECATCVEKAARAAAEALVSGSTQHDFKLGACAVCKCSLRAKVWLPLAPMERDLTDEQRGQLPDACWLQVQPSVPASNPNLVFES